MKSSRAIATANEEARVDKNGDDDDDENGDTDDVDAGNVVDMEPQDETINALLYNKPATPKRKSTQGVLTSSSLSPGADANSSNEQLEASSQSSSKKANDGKA